MKLAPQWLRDFVDLTVDNHQLAQDLTDAGAAVESIAGEGGSMVFEMEITTNRPDEMNHYGLAREASAIYQTPLKSLNGSAPASGKEPAPPFEIKIDDTEGCARYTARVVRDVRIKPSPGW